MFPTAKPYSILLTREADVRDGRRFCLVAVGWDPKADDDQPVAAVTLDLCLN